MKSILVKSLYAAVIPIVFLAFSSSAQITVTGTILDEGTGEPLAGVNILVKGKVIGTITNLDGEFNLRINDNPPITLAISMVGFATQEIEITETTTNLQLTMIEQPILGQEIVVSASRVEENIMESPVSIEKMDILAIQSTAADSYYKGIANLKGVDVTSSSINFQILNTRGFSSTGNTRFVQLIDGMDTQAPALNFPIGNLNGPSELDVESVEILPGAASALYGPNAFNGIILINSKNPFEYQGLSASVKTGVNHIGANADHSISPLMETSVRYAKSYNDKFAFKVNFSYQRAEDWHGTSDIDREEGRTPAGFDFNPGSDLMHYMGDEAAINLAIFRLSESWRFFADNNNLYQTNIFESNYADADQKLTAKDYADAGDLPSHVVSVTPYLEGDLIDYGAENLKASTGLYYRVNDRMELSYLYNAGFGTSIYTGAQRYSLSNFGIQQHRLQLRGDNFMLRAYTTRENSGGSYITEFLAKRVNDLAVNDANPLFSDVSGYLATYGAEYLRHLYNVGLQPGDISSLPENNRIQIMQDAHNFARSATDDKFHLDPNSAEFQSIKEEALVGTIPKGPLFNDNTNMYQADGQYDFKNEIDFMELQAGGTFRLFDLNSNGTIFDDADENITIQEYGGYVQAGRWLGDRTFKITGSLRYDKNENFDGQLNPRIAGVLKFGENHNIRGSFQTGFRNPTTQGQHIDLSILSARLLGGLPRYAEKYDITKTSSTGIPLAYEGFSVQNYRQAVFNQGATQAAIFNPANTDLLVPFTTYEPVKPEQVKSFEVGYKSLIQNRFMIDLVYYYNIYNDFISQVRVVLAEEFKSGDPVPPSLIGTPNYGTILNGTDQNTFQIYTNVDTEVTTQGAAAGLGYNFPGGYLLSGNYSWNVLRNLPEGFLSEFNTPEHKFNIGLSNRKLTDELGFNLHFRWQSEFRWESSFTIPRNGNVPEYGTLDAQLSYKLKDFKSIVKLGGSNLLNRKYIQSLGGPNIGAIYYVSLTFDELLN